ncbi:MAG TPA: DUF4845 domain-containing protein [Burkholderiaceae bacterium]
MHPTRRRLHAPQRGTSLFGLFVIAVIVCFIGLMAMRVFPSVNEFLTVRKVVRQIMHDSPTNPAEIRKSFDRAKDVEYSITSISGKDLDIQQVGDHLRCSFAYNVEIPVVEPVFILIKYSGEASAAGGGPNV